MGQVDLDINGNVIRPVVALMTSTNGTGSPMAFNDGGEMIVSAKSYTIGVAEGDISGHKAWSKLGNVLTSGTTEIDVWYGNSIHYRPTAAQQITIESSSTADAGAGTGIQKVRVGFLDSTYTEQTIEFTLNGTNAISSTNTTYVSPVMSGTTQISTGVSDQIFRVQSIRASAVGSAKAAAGNIIVKSGTNTIAGLATGQTRGRNGFYTVPAGKVLYITSISAGVGYTGNVTNPKATTVKLLAEYDDANNTVLNGFYMPFSEIQIDNEFVSREFEMPIKVPATAEVKLSIMPGGESGTTVKTTLRGWVENE
jgi:hypothetical protein